MQLKTPTLTVEVPDWVTYPDEDWREITPEEAGLDPEKFAAWLAGLDVKGASFLGEDHSERFKMRFHTPILGLSGDNPVLPSPPHSSRNRRSHPPTCSNQPSLYAEKKIV